MDNNENKITHKRCYGKYSCFEIKPIEEFGKSKNSKDGYNCYCKECWNKICIFKYNGKVNDIMGNIPIGFKKCNGTPECCGEIKSIENFIINKEDIQKYSHMCKKCRFKKQELSRKRNPEQRKSVNKKANRVQKSKNKEKNSKINPYLDTSLKKCTRCKKYKERKEFNIDRSSIDGLVFICKRCGKEIRKTNREKERARENKKLTTNIIYKLSKVLRNRLRCFIKGKFKKVGSAVQELGCTVEFLKSYLEERFKPGMSWENYGKLGWHIDHIRPLVLFDLTDPKQVKLACHYTNLQPLWAKENLSKGARYSDPGDFDEQNEFGEYEE